MVQIVGKDQRLVKRATCRNCASILEYTPNEARKRWYTDISQCREEIREITCPGCGQDLQVS